MALAGYSVKETGRSTNSVNKPRQNKHKEPQPENINLPVLYTSTPSNVQNIERGGNNRRNITSKDLSLEYFKILWHEGKQNPNFTDAIFTNWQEVQKHL